jgi:transcriptional regulator with XRE-family HTH domain
MGTRTARAKTAATIDFDAEAEEFLADKLEDPLYRASLEDALQRHGLIDSLISCRKSLGLSQTEVANRMGIKQPSISGFETEGSDPRLSTIQRYARAVDSRIRLVHVMSGSGESGLWSAPRVYTSTVSAKLGSREASSAAQGPVTMPTSA